MEPAPSGSLKTTEAPIKVNEQTKERIRYLAAFLDHPSPDVVYFGCTHGYLSL